MAPKGVQTTWRKSSFSGQNGECVEVARLGGGARGVRDSKNPAAAHLSVSRTAFAALVQGIGVAR